MESNFRISVLRGIRAKFAQVTDFNIDDIVNEYFSKCGYRVSVDLAIKECTTYMLTKLAM